MVFRRRDIWLGGAVGVLLAGHVVVVWAGTEAALRWFGGIVAVALVGLLTAAHVIGLRRLVNRRSRRSRRSG